MNPRLWAAIEANPTVREFYAGLAAFDAAGPGSRRPRPRPPVPRRPCRPLPRARAPRTARRTARRAAAVRAGPESDPEPEPAAPGAARRSRGLDARPGAPRVVAAEGRSS